MPIQRLLLEMLAETFNASDMTFRVGNHIVRFSMWDVYCILGLEDKGSDTVISTKRADPKWFNLYRGGETSITFKYLEEKIGLGAADDHFKRMFVLYAIGNILAPSSKKTVSSKYLDLVIDVSKIKDYNWARFTFEYLVSNLKEFKSKERTGLIGNLALLQVWFFEHFQAEAKCFNYAFHQHPLIKNWDEEKVIKRAKLFGVKQFGTEKVVMHLQLNVNEGFSAAANLDASSGDGPNCGDNVGEDSVGDGFKEGMNYDYVNDHLDQNEKEVLDDENNDGYKREDSNLVGCYSAEKNDELGRQDVLESVSIMVNSAYSNMDGRVQVIEERTKQIPELFTMMQDIIKMLGDNGDPTRCASVTDNGNITNQSKETGSTKNKETLEAKKRKHEGSSPTIVRNVKIRTDRQPSKACISPYQCIKRRIFETNANRSNIDEVTGGLHLSAIEVAAVKFIQKESELHSDEILVRIGESELNGDILSSLVRPILEDGTAKWINAQIINSYATMFNDAWAKDMEEIKYAIPCFQTSWLQNIGRDWIKSGSFPKKTW